MIKTIKTALTVMTVLFTAGTVQAFDSSLEWPENGYYFGPDHPLSIRNADIMLMINAQFPALFPLLPLRLAVQAADAFPAVQKSLDGAYLQMMKRSPTARALCQKLGGGSNENLEIRLGVSRKTASKLSRLCRSEMAGHSDSQQDKVSVLTKRKVFFVFTNDQKVVDSWTSIIQNSTFIFVTKSDFNADYLERTLIHELAIYADGKHRVLQQQLTENPSLTKNRDLKGAIYNPQLLAAFTTARAFEIETQVLGELGKPSGSVSPRNCKDKVYEVLAEATGPFKKSFSMEEYLYARWIAIGLKDHEIKSEIQRFYNFELLLQTLSETLVPGSNQNFCEFLVTPELSRPYLAIASGGPRPNIGSGWGHTQVSEEDRIRINAESMGASYKNIVSTIQTMSRTKHGFGSMNAVTVDMILQESESQNHDGLNATANSQFILESIYGGK